MNKNIHRMEHTAAQEFIEDRMVNILEKLPQICPRIKNISKETGLETVCGKNDNNCYVCNKILVSAEEKVVNILSDVTSRMNSVIDILSTIFKTSNVTTDSNHYLCSACFVMIDRFDNLQAELGRIEAEMSNNLATSQQLREQRFLYGEQKDCNQNVWLSGISVRLNQDEPQPVNLLTRNYPSVNYHTLSIPSQLPDIDIILNTSQLDSLNFAISDHNGQPVVQLDHLLQHSPLFSLSHHNLSIELQETPSHIGKLQCQDCNFVTHFFPSAPPTS